MDVRGNRGGHVSELVVEKLARRVVGWDMPRGRSPATYPQDAPRGPVVALADEHAGSDGDIVTAAIRALGSARWSARGPGAASSASTDAARAGGRHRRSRCRGTRSGSTGTAGSWRTAAWSRTSRCCNSPGDWADGRDPQLETAVRIALEALEARPAAAAPDTALRPSKRRPPLQARPALTDRPAADRRGTHDAQGDARRGRGSPYVAACQVGRRPARRTRAPDVLGDRRGSSSATRAACHSCGPAALSRCR